MMFLSQTDLDVFKIQLFFTGLSDFHKMTFTVLKTKEMFYVDYKNFEQDKFKYKLKKRFQNESI